MIVFPNAKINLGLKILSKRPDGFHNLETIFYPVRINDALEVILSPSSNQIQFTSSGISIDAKENICVKTYHLLKKDFPQLPSVQMHLYKTIPIGAGLGGGSADGAFTLMLLNKKFNLELNQQQLINYALQLGSDCPFFIINKSCYATGRGEKLEEITLDLSSYKIVLVNPQIHISTVWAFSQIKLSRERKSLKEIILLPIAKWKNELTNDFEEAVFSQHPEIKTIKEEMYKADAVYASMSGSGSTVFGLFENAITLPSFSSNYFVKIL